MLFNIVLPKKITLKTSNNNNGSKMQPLCMQVVKLMHALCERRIKLERPILKNHALLYDVGK